MHASTANVSAPNYLRPCDPRNCKSLRVSYEFLENVLKLKSQLTSPEFEFSQQGFPEDGKIIEIRPDSNLRDFICIVSSSTFPEVAFGEPLPEMVVTFTRRVRDAQED